MGGGGPAPSDGKPQDVKAKLLNTKRHPGGFPGQNAMAARASRLAVCFLLRGRSVQLTRNRCRFLGFAHTFSHLRGTRRFRAPKRRAAGAERLQSSAVPSTFTSDAITWRLHLLPGRSVQRERGEQVSSAALLVWLLLHSPLLAELLLIPVQSGRGGGPG